MGSSHRLSHIQSAAPWTQEHVQHGAVRCCTRPDLAHSATRQARLEAEQREAERRREEVLEAELQAQQAAAALTDRLHEAERDAAAASADLQVRTSYHPVPPHSSVRYGPILGCIRVALSLDASWSAISYESDRKRGPHADLCT